MFYKDSDQIYRAAPLDRFEWLRHGFGTRHSGAPAGSPVVTLRQIHSTKWLYANGGSGCLGEGDALLDNTPDVLLAVKTADCLPVLLVDERNRAVAAVHAGWRGTVGEIAQHAVAAMQKMFSTRPADLHAAIGPGIGQCCFEVGPEVQAQFQAVPAGAVRAHGVKFKIDLAAVNRFQLTDSGVPEEHIYVAELCTVCGAADFHSYRRDREKAGRMFSAIGLR